VTKACIHYCVVIVTKKYTLKWKATRRFLGVIMEVSFRNLQTFRVEIPPLLMAWKEASPYFPCTISKRATSRAEWEYPFSEPWVDTLVHWLSSKL